MGRGWEFLQNFQTINSLNSNSRYYHMNFAFQKLFQPEFGVQSEACVRLSHGPNCNNLLYSMLFDIQVIPTVRHGSTAVCTHVPAYCLLGSTSAKLDFRKMPKSQNSISFAICFFFSKCYGNSRVLLLLVQSFRLPWISYNSWSYVIHHIICAILMTLCYWSRKKANSLTPYLKLELSSGYV